MLHLERLRIAVVSVVLAVGVPIGISGGNVRVRRTRPRLVPGAHGIPAVRNHACIDHRRRESEPQLVRGRVEHAGERPDPGTRIVQVGAVRIVHAGRGLTHRARPVEHDHDVERLDRARSAGGCGRVHRQLGDADDPSEPRRHLRLRLDDDAVHAAVAPVAAGNPGKARDLGGRGRVADRVHRVLVPGRRAVLHRHGLGHRRVGKMLRARERCRVDAGLELALDEHRVADVDDQPDHDDHERHGDRRHHQDLAALIGRRSTHPAAGPRLAAVETRKGHPRTERHRSGYCHPSI